MNRPSSFHKVIEHFHSRGWSCSWDPTAPVIHAATKGNNTRFRLHVEVNDADTLVVVWATLPIVVPLRRSVEAAALCAYLSNGMRMGRFEVDPVARDIRFQASSAYPPGALADSVIQRLIGVTVVMLDEHFPAFVEVIFGKAPPAEAAIRIRAQICHYRAPKPTAVHDSGARISFN